MLFFGMLVCGFLLLANTLTGYGEHPWLNVTLPLHDRLESLLDAMNQTEMISQLVKYSQRIDRLRVPAYPWHMEAAHGLSTGGSSTVFPCSLARAAAFDPELEESIARAIAVEARAKWNLYQKLHGSGPPFDAEGLSLTPYAPEINLCRDPHWGRCQESRGEDPWLTARLTVPFVQGLQRYNASTKQLLTAAMLKDVFVYNLESDFPVGGHDGDYRLRYNAIVSEADLHQSFMPAFVAGIVHGDARAAMTSYHALNGIPSSAHPILEQELRRNLKWEGVIMSDGGAVTDILRFRYLGLPMTDNITAAAAAALNAGVDLNSGGFMHGQNPPGCKDCVANMSGYAYEHLFDALKAGMVDSKTLRKSAARVLKLRFELGLFDPPSHSPFSHFGQNHIDNDQHRKLALSSASKSLVLLRNQDSTLPLPRNLKRLAIIGPNADAEDALLSNYNGCSKRVKFINSQDPSPPCNLITPLRGIRAYVNSSTEVLFAKGCDWASNDSSKIKHAVDIATKSDAAVVILGLVSVDHNNDSLENERQDRTSLALPGQQAELLRAVAKAQPRTILVIISGGFVSEPSLMRGPEAVPAIVYQFYPGGLGGTALASALFGVQSFSGRLPVTAVADTSQLPPYFDQQLSKPPGRTHRYLVDEPLFSFGFGITTLAINYAGLALSPRCFSADTPPENITVSFTVSVRGSMKPGVTQDEVAQVYVGYVRSEHGEELDQLGRDHGNASIPLHELRAFKRISLYHASTVQKLSFQIAVRDLFLMRPDGTMGLLAGQWSVWVGGTSPRTPGRLLRNATAAGQPEGSPQPLLRAMFHIKTGRSEQQSCDEYAFI